VTFREAAVLVALPMVSALWGVTWAFSRRDLDDDDAPTRWWSDPRVVVGVVWLVVALQVTVVDVLGSVLVRLAVLVPVPFLLGLALGRAARAHAVADDE